MRMFFSVVGVLAWIAALAVLWIFAESGGALTIIAAGIYALVAMVALGCERILKTLEDIRDGRIVTSRPAPVTTAARRVRDQPGAAQRPHIESPSYKIAGRRHLRRRPGRGE